MKHLCIFIAWFDLETIKTSFESIYLDEIDYFVIENNSKYSEQIKEYFLTKKLVGYIQFEKNIIGTAIDIFLKDYIDFINQYDIITFTDCDVFVVDARDMFNEIIENLNVPNVVISAGRIWPDNFIARFTKHNQYLIDKIEDKNNKIIGVDNFKEKMKNRKEVHGMIKDETGIQLATIKKENMNMITEVHFHDHRIKKILRKNNKLWVSTQKNYVYHMSWDMGFNEYGETKKNAYGKHRWDEMEPCNYIKII